MPTTQELINAGYGGYAGWSDAEANADFNATGGAGKQTSGGSGGSSSPSLPPFSFDQKAAENSALEELRPYYEKLLKIYNGNIQLAKQRIEQDYERGLRYKTNDVNTGKSDIAANRAERNRKFQIALGDLDQEMNGRGLYNSGIKTTEQNKAKADEAYQQSLLDRQSRDLDTGLSQYKEEQGTNLNRFYEDKGLKTPTGAPDFVSEPEQYKSEQSQKMATQAIDMANMKRSQRYQEYQTGATPIIDANPSNWGDVLNKALKMQGLPTNS